MDKPPNAYIHGLDGAGIVIVPGRIAHALDRLFDLRRIRVEIRGQDSEVDAVLICLAAAGARWHAAATGRPQRQEPAPAPPWYSTTTAADTLDLAPRTVRLACQTGDLTAQRIDGRWRIKPADLAHYRARRTT